MVGSKIQSAAWVSDMLRSKFFDSCKEHSELRKSEKNLFCIDCKFRVCKHCVACSSHRLLQICKYVYHDVVRLHDIQKFLDCSQIQAYKINGEKAVHLNPRPPGKDAKGSKPKIAGGGASCKTCGRHIQEFPNRFCSIACKVWMESDITTRSKILSLPPAKKVIDLPSVDSKQNFNENGCGSPLLSPTNSSSSEVIQALSNSNLKPRKTLRKRKGIPRRSPFW
ncbi:protein RGF1 INDUCIBLE TRANSCRIPTION FACTOR 1 [Andrographis paniculata]|uniref:protein RGF1 INDUCIBLE TRANSCRIPTION FACTOR 1 n=1 Tax=Andrographis paniculata TaxID=175694 RepID=UPI0021E8A4E0|nr:protein RGF1 INDUCIBLE TRANSCRIPTION FACTOR 1 [Andrographis paniculata]